MENKVDNKAVMLDDDELEKVSGGYSGYTGLTWTCPLCGEVENLPLNVDDEYIEESIINRHLLVRHVEKKEREGRMGGFRPTALD